MLLPERRPVASHINRSPGNPRPGVVIQYNTLLGASSVFDCSPTMIVRGNIFPSVRGGLCGFGQAPKYSYNVWQTGPACGATDRVCTPSFANTAVRDVHLAAADTCAKDHGDPATY